MLVVGGAGVFGSRFVDGVLATTDLHVVVAGRDLARSTSFIAARNGSGRLTASVIDTATVTPEALRATGAIAVVDAAGPFQGQDYRLARAAIQAAIHYIDLADGRAFVAGIAALDTEARSAGVAVLSGASSTPALSNAVLDAITAGWHQVDDVCIAIVPGNRAPRGLSVVQSILSYTGRPLRVFLDGAWRTRPGWGMTRRLRIAGLGHRFVSLCDTPDLDIVVQRFGVRRSVRFLAGLELPLLHLGLVAAGLLVRAGLVRSLVPWAGLARRASALFEHFGADRGGMVVDARGLDAEGACAHATWTLLAEAGDGPSVPTLPALAVLRALLDGGLPWRGAGPCAGLLPLPAIEREFARLRITTHPATRTQPPGHVFPTVLGAAFGKLPEPIRAVHRPGWASTLDGRADVGGPSGWIAGAVARLFAFPPAAEGVPVRVTIARTAQGERWTRDFAGRRFTSHLRPGGTPALLIERFGPFRFDIAMLATQDTLRFTACGWRLGPLRLPRVLAPVSTAVESLDPAGRFHFDVEIGLPFRLGRIVRYTGWLAPAAPPSAARALQP